VNYFKNKGDAKIISVDGANGIKEVTADIMGQLD